MSDKTSFAVFLEANQAAQIALGAKGADNPWVGSPFEWVMSLPSRSRGKAGELLTAAWLEKLGYECRPSGTTQYDRLVEGRRVEIKFSTLWQSGEYVFQQLRLQDYEFAFLLGVSPNDASAWFVPKDVVLEVAVPQHGGSTGVDTRWIRFPAIRPPATLEDFGGTLDAAANALRQVLG